MAKFKMKMSPAQAEKQVAYATKLRNQAFAVLHPKGWSAKNTKRKKEQKLNNPSSRESFEAYL